MATFWVRGTVPLTHFWLAGLWVRGTVTLTQKKGVQNAPGKKSAVCIWSHILIFHFNCDNLLCISLCCRPGLKAVSWRNCLSDWWSGTRLAHFCVSVHYDFAIHNDAVWKGPGAGYSHFYDVTHVTAGHGSSCVNSLSRAITISTMFYKGRCT